MSAGTYRIESLSIEGFKAFTSQQVFSFEGRSVFFFGENGMGKTSIVEAIRWCLFGLASRPGEIIKNQFYNGPCIVQIRLQGPDGLWTMQRRLRPSSGESDLTIQDPFGVVRNLEDVFPQLSRIGPMEGTHVIYAPQQPSSRRPEADITDFSYVVYRYLGLEEVPRLASALASVDSEWLVDELAIKESIEDLSIRIDQAIADTDNRLNRIVASPGWSGGLTPTQANTRAHVDALAEEAIDLGASIDYEELQDLPVRERLYEIETAVNARLEQGLEEASFDLQQRESQLQTVRSLLERAEEAVRQVALKQERKQTVESELVRALGGVELPALEAQLSQMQSEFDSELARRDVIESAIRCVEVSGMSALCPVCDTAFAAGELSEHLANSESNLGERMDDLLYSLSRIKNRIAEAQQLQQQNTLFDADLQALQVELDTILNDSASATGEASIEGVGALQATVGNLQTFHSNLQTAINSRTDAQQSWAERIEAAKVELQFHDLRNLKERLQRLQSVRIPAVWRDHGELAQLRVVAGDTKALLNSQLRSRLDVDLPPLASEMTEVYLRLTGNPIFDTISIEHGENLAGLISLDLRVSSSRGIGTWGVEQGVLNGQALNAMQLVPYFVFSQYQDSPLLDLLLLDDPTQAFDTQKIQLLLTELAQASEHATLFVASHETDRFGPALKDYFESDRVKAFRALGIDADKGPQFEEVSIVGWE